MKYKVTSEQLQAVEKDDRNTPSIKVSKEVSDLIREASPYELDEILAKVLNKEEVISLISSLSKEALSLANFVALN